MNSLVSIIIPTYNRGDLIVETIHSIQNQNYSFWECIVAGDGSADNTASIFAEISAKDARIKFFKRPEEKPKGANVCRNLGFNKSKGDYIIWFDSDDLMTPDHVEVKLMEIKNSSQDFVVARTCNFKAGVLQEPYKYEKESNLSKIHWYTYDVLLKREIAEKISWNEQMRSWQDYNYFCKMLLETEKGIYIDKILTYRRLHAVSIQSALNKDKVNYSKEIFENRLHTFEDVKNRISCSTKTELIFGLMNLVFFLAKTSRAIENVERVDDIVKRNFGRKSFIIFRTALLSNYYLKRGFFLLEWSKPRKYLNYINR